MAYAKSGSGQGRTYHTDVQRHTGGISSWNTIAVTKWTVVQTAVVNNPPATQTAGAVGRLMSVVGLASEATMPVLGSYATVSNKCGYLCGWQRQGIGNNSSAPFHHTSNYRAAPELQQCLTPVPQSQLDPVPRTDATWALDVLYYSTSCHGYADLAGNNAAFAKALV